ncbi:Ras-related GTP-binding protein D [Eumeta japonica]|uniref:Ras-related GTP-binding protein D n=1 Tax=Eumeta variegata TaxID=151549 RepID=A0A4C1UTD5_EUMVA|nr:Ras-related GTP-binding protein D [Eumeta japonica]
MQREGGTVGIVDHADLTVTMSQWSRWGDCTHSQSFDEFASENFPQKLISRIGDIPWPSRSPDLTPMDFFLWGYLKERVYNDNPQSPVALKENICRETSSIELSLLQCVAQNTRVRFEQCVQVHDDYMDALNKLQLTVTKAYKVNTNIKFEVFIHKVDGLSDDYKMESQRDIHQRATDDLADAGLEHIHLSFHLTSIYDHSIFEAFSKVVQKLIPQLPTLENLLNILISNSGIEKAFLFDVVSKIYIATDSSPVDMQSYELCCDMIDVVIDVSCIYGSVDESETNAFNSQSSSLIKLNNGTVLYLREVNKFLALQPVAALHHSWTSATSDLRGLFLITCRQNFFVCEAPSGARPSAVADVADA